MRRCKASTLHLWATVFWSTAGAAVTGWAIVHYDEPPWIALMSLYAIVVGHWSTYEAAKAKEAAEA